MLAKIPPALATVFSVMAVNSLSFRIVVLVGGLLCVTSLAILIAVWLATYTHAQNQVEANLELAVNVFEQVMANRENQLINTAEVLTADFGFKQAVASNDEKTLQSALLNQSARINADLMAILSLEGEVLAATEQRSSLKKALIADKVIRQVLSQGYGSLILANDQGVFQIFALTVDAPVPIAMALVGFRLNEDFAALLKEITKLDITFASFSGTELPRLVSTLPVDDPGLFLSRLDSDRQHLRLPFSSSSYYRSKSYRLYQDSNTVIEVYLTDDLNRVFSEFDLLQLEIAVIALLALCLALLTGLLFSRTLTASLLALVDVTRDIARGNYQKRIDISAQTDEVSDLVAAFSLMQSGIRDREERIVFQASHDLLTGLINRLEISRQLEIALEEGHPFYLLGINVVNFRAINDMFGHPVGDRCLQAIATRLQRTRLLAARLGGGDFMVLFPGSIQSQDIQHLRQKLQVPYDVDSLNIRLDFNFGVVAFPQHATDVASLIRRMEIAVDYANQQPEHLHFYHPGQESEYIQRLRLMDDLSRAINSNDFGLTMYFQPSLNLGSGEIDRAEALLRWFHPKQGFISPELFVPLAEQAGLINLLTEWVIRQVAEQIALWRARGITIVVAINLSAKDITRSSLLEYISGILAANGLESGDVSFEITESELMKQPDQAIKTLQNIRDAGFDLAIDDFGTGYSSLSQLKLMPVSELKIDRCFVTYLAENSDDQTIVRSTIALAHSFNLQIVAEGVEDNTALLLLTEWGCNHAQGYLIARPMPSEELIGWLSDFSRDKPNNGVTSP